MTTRSSRKMFGSSSDRPARPCLSPQQIWNMDHRTNCIFGMNEYHCPSVTLDRSFLARNAYLNRVVAGKEPGKIQKPIEFAEKKGFLDFEIQHRLHVPAPNHYFQRPKASIFTTQRRRSHSMEIKETVLNASKDKKGKLDFQQICDSAINSTTKRYQFLHKKREMSFYQVDRHLPGPGHYFQTPPGMPDAPMNDKSPQKSTKDKGFTLHKKSVRTLAVFHDCGQRGGQYSSTRSLPT